MDFRPFGICGLEFEVRLVSMVVHLPHKHSVVLPQAGHLLTLSVVLSCMIYFFLFWSGDHEETGIK